MFSKALVFRPRGCGWTVYDGNRFWFRKSFSVPSNNSRIVGTFSDIFEILRSGSNRVHQYITFSFTGSLSFSATLDCFDPQARLRSSNTTNNDFVNLPCNTIHLPQSPSYDPSSYRSPQNRPSGIHLTQLRLNHIQPSKKLTNTPPCCLHHDATTCNILPLGKLLS